MVETNIVVVLWQLSLLASIICLIIGLIKRSWPFLLISTITFLPIAIYFLGVNNYLKSIAFTPIILFMLTILFFSQFHKKRI